METKFQNLVTSAIQNVLPFTGYGQEINRINNVTILCNTSPLPYFISIRFVLIFR